MPTRADFANAAFLAWNPHGRVGRDRHIHRDLVAVAILVALDPANSRRAYYDDAFALVGFSTLFCIAALSTCCLIAGRRGFESPKSRDNGSMSRFPDRMCVA